MALLFDKIRRSEKPSSSWDPNGVFQKHFFNEAQVILASNISRYYFQESPKEYWFAKDFPNIAPPFPFMWIEFERPEYIFSEKFGGRTEWDPTRRPNRWAIAIVVYEPKKDDLPKHITDNLGCNPRWVLHCFLYLQMVYEQETDKAPIFQWLLPVNEDGTLGKNGDDASTLYSSIPYRGEEYSKQMRMEAEPLLHTALLTLCFMHCSNVKVANVEPHPRHNKHHVKAYKLPLITYKTLEIEPMKRVLKVDGGSDSVGIQQAMHVCRGHFKHFGPQWGKGKLFGKIDGMIWWQDMVRGNVEKGMVVKDYEVKK